MTWIDDAIANAKARGMVPFVVVLPVSPRLLRTVPEHDLTAMVGQMASEEIVRQVRAWRDVDDAA